jgi:predicted MFS family arabinose efflux permease
MFATALALVAQEFEGRERVRAIAAWGATAGFAVAVGPLAGGLVTQTLGWPWIFFVNVPVGGFTIAVARLKMSEMANPTPRRVDVAGLLCFSAALVMLVLALLRGNADGWSSARILALLLGAGLLLIAFVVIEHRAQEPMLDLALFRRPAFVGVSAGTVAIGAGMFAMFIYLSFLLQNGFGYSPIGAGLRMLPITGLAFAVPLLTRRIAGRLAPGILLSAGLLLVSLGLFLMHGVSVGSGWIHLLGGMVIAGIGIGLCNPSIAAIALAVVSQARAGMASGFSNTCRVGGVAIGIAGLGAIFQHGIAIGLQRRLGSAGRSLAGAVTSAGPHAVAHRGAALVAASRQAFMDGFNDMLLAGAGILLVGGLIALLLVGGRALLAQPEPLIAKPIPPELG